MKLAAPGIRSSAVGTLFLVALATAACSSGNTSADAGPAPVYTPETCTNADDLAVRDGMGHLTCTPVGASRTMPSAVFPDVTGLPTPIAYVQSGATGGDGTQAHPFGDIDTALALTPAPATIVIGTGTLTLAHAVHLTSNTMLIGAGAAGSILSSPAGATAIELTGPSAHATIKGLTIQFVGGPLAGDMSAGIDITGGASGTISDILITGSHDGIRAIGSGFHADHVTVRAGQRHGILLTGGSDATIDSLRVSETAFGVAGDGVGVAVASSHLDITMSSITDNARDGLVFMGGMPGMTDHVTQVSSLRNGVTAMRADGMDTANCVVAIARSSLSGTVVPAGTVGGDGLFITGQAQVTLDSDVTSVERRGLGTAIVGNARSGVLANGHGTAIAMHGALVGSNLGPGVFMQSEAGASAVEFNDVGSNGALGIGVTAGASAAEMTANTFHHTVSAMIMTSAGPLSLADGLSMSEGTSTASVTGNDFSGNGRFGAIFAGSNATLSNNTGSANLYGVGAYEATVTIDSSNHIGGAMASPTATPPAARGALSF